MLPADLPPGPVGKRGWGWGLPTHLQPDSPSQEILSLLPLACSEPGLRFPTARLPSGHVPGSSSPPTQPGAANCFVCYLAFLVPGSVLAAFPDPGFPTTSGLPSNRGRGSLLYKWNIILFERWGADLFHVGDTIV